MQPDGAAISVMKNGYLQAAQGLPCRQKCVLTCTRRHFTDAR
jgi:hypothetical protein